MWVGQMEAILGAIEGDRGAVLILEQLKDALDRPFVASHNPGEAGFGRVGSGTEFLEQSLVEFDGVESGPFSFDQRVSRHGESILRTLPADIAGLAVAVTALLTNGAGKGRGVGRVRASLDRQLGRLAWVGSTEEREYSTTSVGPRQGVVGREDLGALAKAPPFVDPKANLDLVGGWTGAERRRRAEWRRWEIGHGAKGGV